MARPTIYSDELVDKICSRLAVGESMRSVCLDDAMPEMQTIWRWLREKPEFSERYARAKAESADALVEDMQNLADTAELDKNAIAKARLQVDTRKWIAAKLKPKKYGDKLDVESGGKPITFIVNRGGDEQTNDND